MRMDVSTSIPLSEPNVDDGLITWFRIEIFDDDETPARPVGRAQAGRIHASHAFDCGESIYDALDADSGELEALYEVFFEDGWLKDDLSEGSGSDVLYVADIDIRPPYQAWNIDFAVVRRLCDSLGQGAALAVMPYESTEEIARWAQLGFEVATPGADEGYLFLRLTHRTARVDDSDKPGHFKVLPNPAPEEAENHH